ncbi:hypothetical protein [Pseudoalteromonas sp.]|uniref:hypothetical protein n=1 Tax=Pseudoalteromonas sp. TaxID=53249 RepID=UPI002630853E|nr:hypothetical protein [Pseudoalteromonas sp.]MCP4586904.1 hypothetical protein [Pseudoalteromonas sp.]
MSNSVTLTKLAQKISGDIHHLTIADKTDFLPMLKAQYASLLPQIRSAEVREQLRRELEKKLRKNKDLASQSAAYREEWFRVTKIIEEEKAERKRLARKRTEEEAL